MDHPRKSTIDGIQDVPVLEIGIFVGSSLQEVIPKFFIGCEGLCEVLCAGYGARGLTQMKLIVIEI